MGHVDIYTWHKPVEEGETTPPGVRWQRHGLSLRNRHGGPEDTYEVRAVRTLQMGCYFYHLECPQVVPLPVADVFHAVMTDALATLHNWEREDKANADLPPHSDVD